MDIFKTTCKFQKPMRTPSGRKVTQAEREREKNAINSGHLVPCQRMQATRTNLL